MKIGMRLILRRDSVQGVDSTVNDFADWRFISADIYCNFVYINLTVGEKAMSYLNISQTTEIGKAVHKILTFSLRSDSCQSK